MWNMLPRDEILDIYDVCWNKPRYVMFQGVRVLKTRAHGALSLEGYLMHYDFHMIKDGKTYTPIRWRRNDTNWVEILH
jgi:hypothetical protein